MTCAKEYMTRGLFGNVTGRSLRGNYALGECVSSEMGMLGMLSPPK